VAAAQAKADAEAAAAAALTATQASTAAAKTAADAAAALVAAQAAADATKAEADRLAELARQATEAAAAAKATAEAAAARLVGTSVTTVPVADTYVNEGTPTTSYPKSSSLMARGTPGARSYLSFQLPAAPAGTRLYKAELRVRTTTDPYAGSLLPFQVSLLSSAWPTAPLTWATRLTEQGAVLGAVPTTVYNTPYVAGLDVTQLASALGRQTTLSITAAGNDALYLWSADAVNAGYRPQLVLSFR
jgi:multidrug efflux pump subunit AcrA (membrane-fusion protein)